MGLGPSQQLPARQPLLPNVQEQPQLSQATATATLHSDSSVDRNSFQLHPSDTSPHVLFLDFAYNSHYDCIVDVYFFCTERIDPSTHRKQFTTDTHLFPRPISLRLSKGYHQPAPHGAISIDVTKHVELLTFENPSIVPIVLEISPDPSSSSVPQCHTSFLCFSQESGVWKVKLLQQRLFTQGRYFILHEFFGVQRQNHPDEESSECVVCMTDRRNTAVLPCRHMCLCSNCANIVRSQPSSKCPICRSQVDSLMQLIVEADEQ